MPASPQVPRYLSATSSSVMIEKFAGICSTVLSEFLDLNHTSNTVILSVPHDFEVRSRTQLRAPANFESGHSRPGGLLSYRTSVAGPHPPDPIAGRRRNPPADLGTLFVAAVVVGCGRKTCGNAIGPIAPAAAAPASSTPGPAPSAPASADATTGTTETTAGAHTAKAATAAHATAAAYAATMETTTTPSGEGCISKRKSHQHDTGKEHNDPAHGSSPRSSGVSSWVASGAACGYPAQP